MNGASAILNAASTLSATRLIRHSPFVICHYLPLMHPLLPFLLFLACFLTVASATQAPASARPNILLVVADDLGYGELGCQGNPQVPTPHIDSLARHGIRFTSGYVTAPYCAPSRAGLMTGRHQARFGYDINPVGSRNLDPGLGLPVDQVTLADLLRRSGYATMLVGKWHLGGTPSFHPLRRGFDRFYGFLHEGHFYAPAGRPDTLSFLRTNQPGPGSAQRWTVDHITWSRHTPVNEPPYDAHNPILRDTEPLDETEFLTDAWARQAEAFIRQHRTKPFFLELAFNAPHSPMQALRSTLRPFQHIPDPHRRVFAAMVSHLDQSIGRVLAVLRELDLEDRTLIFFLSDNGGPTAELTSSNAPLSGGKGSLLEGGIRVPFIVQWKGRLPAGQVYPHPVTSLDILPTALAAAGAPAPSANSLDGVNLLPFLSGERQDPPHPVLFWRYLQSCAVRRGDWKLLRLSAPSAWRLHHLATDIGEARDLSAEYPERVDQLRNLLQEWLGELPPPITMNVK